MRFGWSIGTQRPATVGIDASSGKGRTLCELAPTINVNCVAFSWSGGDSMTVPAEARPRLVYVPARPRDTDGGRNVGFEMRRQPDGTSVLPAYSSLTGLVEALGRYQPWVCVHLTQLLEALDGGRLGRVLLDPQVEPGAWRWTQAD